MIGTLVSVWSALGISRTSGAQSPLLQGLDFPLRIPSSPGCLLVAGAHPCQPVPSRSARARHSLRSLANLTGKVGESCPGSAKLFLLWPVTTVESRRVAA